MVSSERANGHFDEGSGDSFDASDSGQCKRTTAHSLAHLSPLSHLCRISPQHAEVDAIPNEVHGQSQLWHSVPHHNPFAYGLQCKDNIKGSSGGEVKLAGAKKTAFHLLPHFVAVPDHTSSTLPSTHLEQK